MLQDANMSFVTPAISSAPTASVAIFPGMTALSASLLVQTLFTQLVVTELSANLLDVTALSASLLELVLY